MKTLISFSMVFEAAIHLGIPKREDQFFGGFSMIFSDKEEIEETLKDNKKITSEWIPSGGDSSTMSPNHRAAGPHTRSTPLLQDGQKRA